MSKSDSSSPSSASNSSSSSIYPMKLSNNEIVVYADIEPHYRPYSSYVELSTINAASPNVKIQEILNIPPKKTIPKIPDAAKALSALDAISEISIDAEDEQQFDNGAKSNDVVMADAPIQETRSAKRRAEVQNIANITETTAATGTTIKKPKTLPRSKKAAKFVPNGTGLKDYCLEVVKYGRELEKRKGKGHEKEKSMLGKIDTPFEMFSECNRVKRKLEKLLKELETHPTTD